MTDVSQVFESSRPPVLVPVAATRTGASTHNATLSALPSSNDIADAQPEEELAAGDECTGCGGWGAITCPSCDGIEMWTEAGESPGLNQRDAARTLEHCACCIEWGEVICPDYVEVRGESRQRTRERVGRIDNLTQRRGCLSECASKAAALGDHPRRSGGKYSLAEPGRVPTD